MRRGVLVCVVWAVLSTPVGAQDCTPTYGWGNTYWSTTAQNAAHFGGNTAHAYGFPVPVGQLWKMRTISLSTTDGRQMEYFVEHLVTVTGGNHYHRIAGGWGAGTPALHVPPGDAAALILLPGERLAARSNPPGGVMVNDGMMLLYSYFSFPHTPACLARALHLEAAVSGGGVPVNFTSLADATASLAEAAAQIHAAVDALAHRP